MVLILAVIMFGILDGHRCITWTLLGAMAGCAAYAQDGGDSVITGGGDFGLLVELLKAGGLPAVLGITGWLFGKGGLPVTIQLSEPDRKLLEKLAEDEQKRRK